MHLLVISRETNCCYEGVEARSTCPVLVIVTFTTLKCCVFNALSSKFAAWNLSEDTIKTIWSGPVKKIVQIPILHSVPSLNQMALLGG